jgi:hypothetical protein
MCDIKDELNKAIDTGDKIKVQSILETMINADAKNVEFKFNEYLDYAAEKLHKKNISLFDEDNGDTDLNMPEEKWNINLWNSVRSKLKYNFSKEKADFIIRVMNYLRNVKKEPYFIPQANRSEIHEKQDCREKHVVHNNTEKKVNPKKTQLNDGFKKARKEFEFKEEKFHQKKKDLKFEELL